MYKQRRITVLHRFTGARQYVVLPLGLFYNSELLQAQKNDIVEFVDNGKKVLTRFLRCCEISTRTPMFTFLMRSLYGDAVNIAQIKREWVDLAITLGLGRKGIDADRALVVEVECLNSRI